MRIHAHLLLGLCVLAVAVSTAAAAPYGDEEAGYAAAGPQAQPAQPHHHHGLFGRRHCVECQRAYVKSHDGVDVPPPPYVEPGAVVGGPVLAAQVSSCPTCQGGSVVTGPVMASNAPGYAVVGGPGVMASNDAPGYAVVGEVASAGEPAPIGVSRAGQAPWGDTRMAAMGARPGAGPYDPSVVPTAIPPAQVALAGPASNRPHIIGHLFHVPEFGRHRREREDKERQKHASISYDQPAGKVTELPAEMVYGKGGH